MNQPKSRMKSRWRKLARTVSVFLHLGLVIWLCVTVLFGALIALKGNPISMFLDPRLDRPKQEQLKRAYGYEQTPLVQYGRYLGNIAQGDLGISFIYKRPVAAILPGRLAFSMGLGLAAYAVATLWTLILLYFMETRHHRWLKHLAASCHTFCLATPSFVLATLFLGLFGTRFHWFPMVGSSSLFAEDLATWPFLKDRLYHALLPVLSLAIPICGQLTAYLRAQLQLLEEQPFVLSARGRGLSEVRIFWNHKLRVLLPGVIQMAGLYLPATAAGTLVVESVYGWSGMGLLISDAVAARDMPLLIGGSLATIILVFLGYEGAARIRGSLSEVENPR